MACASPTPARWRWGTPRPSWPGWRWPRPSSRRWPTSRAAAFGWGRSPAPTPRCCPLAAETWIEGAHPDCLGPLEDFFAVAGFEPRIGFHCDDWTGKQALVAGGLGVMLFPSLALPSARDDIVLRPLSPPLPARRVLATLADRARSRS